MKIYLAGKVDAEHGAWRDALLGRVYNDTTCTEYPKWELTDHGGTFEQATESYNWGRVDPPEWPQVPNTHVLGIHEYVGPYRLTYPTASPKSSGYFHGTTWLGQHGSIDNHQDHIVRQCVRAMSRADLIFAYVNTPDCFGTLTEIGMARAMGKYIALVIDDQAWWDGDDYWFIQHLVSWSSVLRPEIWIDFANALTRPDTRAEEICIRDRFRDALVQWTARPVSRPGARLALMEPNDRQVMEMAIKDLKAAEQVFAQITRWTSDPRVRDEAERMRKYLAS